MVDVPSVGASGGDRGPVSGAVEVAVGVVVLGAVGVERVVGVDVVGVAGAVVAVVGVVGAGAVVGVDRGVVSTPCSVLSRLLGSVSAGGRTCR